MLEQNEVTPVKFEPFYVISYLYYKSRVQNSYDLEYKRVPGTRLRAPQSKVPNIHGYKKNLWYYIMYNVRCKKKKKHILNLHTFYVQSFIYNYKQLLNSR